MKPSANGQDDTLLLFLLSVFFLLCWTIQPHWCRSYSFSQNKTFFFPGSI